MGYCLLYSVYCNSLLATLNVRNEIRSRGHSDPGIPLYHTPDPNAPVVGSQNTVIPLASWLRPWSKLRTPEQRSPSLSMPPIRVEVYRSVSQDLQSPTPGPSKLSSSNQNGSHSKGSPPLDTVPTSEFVRSPESSSWMHI
jgi:hypothetical protein